MRRTPAFVRSLTKAVRGDPELGPFAGLPGKWVGCPGQGWNLIALPFAGSPLGYRLLINRTSEVLTFSQVDKNVPNRGLCFDGSNLPQDQFLTALRYTQDITQVSSEDFPASGLATNDAPLHNEIGMMLFAQNETDDSDALARLATIPHGTNVLATGNAHVVDGSVEIPTLNAFPKGVGEQPQNPYLQPYLHFVDNPVDGVFSPDDVTRQLRDFRSKSDVVRTQILRVETRSEAAGITAMPFLKRQANACDMSATYWLETLHDRDAVGRNILQLSYVQCVHLAFFPRRDDTPGLIKWPHISVNTLRLDTNI